MFGVTLVVDGCYWFGALQGPLQKQSLQKQFCLDSDLLDNSSKDWGQVTGKNLFGVTLVVDGCYWFGALQGPLHCKSSSALTQTCLTSTEQSNPGLGPSHGKELGVTLVVDGCYWFGALQGPLHCKSSSALTQTCLTSKEQSNPGLGPSHGKELVRGYFGRGWLLLVWSSARATSLQKQFCLDSDLLDK